MQPLKMEIKKQEQKGLDTLLEIKVSESKEDGGKSTIVQVTLLNAQSDQVKMDAFQGGNLFYTPPPDNAPCILQIGAPISAPLL